ncbi:UNVERIFIED_CONTAM: Rosmarinate synthase [Sesamum angustifolium]|uniref:Rosmarinate synthase n=1 Tax=Sesamum angustifolium TaxID=2727405 RepID=A0AAW2QUD5_9LAMI
MAQWVQELHFPQLDIPIIIDKVEPILSNSNIPANNDSLYLSNLDDMVGVRVFTPTVYFYQSKGLKSRLESVVQILKDSLRRVLVPYYPFTGRLRETKNGKLEVFFGPDQGALLVEAHSDVALADLGDLSVPNPAWIKLIYRFPNEEEYKVVDMPLVIAQGDQIQLWWTQPCSCVEILVKALDVKPLDYELRLTFSVNARAKLKNPRLNDGFYGNALCVACTTSTVSKLIDGCLAETAHLVHEARLGVSEDYLRSTIDYIDLHRPKRLEFGGKLTVTQWTRFSIYESADFGWGKPIYAGPIDLTPTPQVCVFLPEGGETEASGAMVLCICLPECACHRFRELLLSHGFK